MTKKFLLEQCRRSTVFDFKETENEPYWRNHDEGKESIRREFVEFLNTMDDVNRKKIEKWLRGIMKVSWDVYDEIDGKYDYTVEHMTPEEDRRYAYHEGRECMADLLLRIIMKKEYIWKV
ncbi:hypothetical protein EAL2_808p02020 (plasmid) [Peptoclostridium acidaminophilum DSM 3953]|uniref:Uncharacterized protein n=1 Tax=Peptoclostridium acidaminophilum DSM 3953 TaxID=1286171 RepID=W8TNG7_PEPAC|nr:hypothetical protein [Peptoclostridium acidaminophilum]AHM57707.1 hypothetical protein EAL2_808p02020 [Peptoclostridium acidaminophilum DSM 3953]